MREVYLAIRFGDEIPDDHKPDVGHVFAEHLNRMLEREAWGYGGARVESVVDATGAVEQAMNDAGWEG